MGQFPEERFLGLGAVQIVIGIVVLLLNIANAIVSVIMLVACEDGCEGYVTIYIFVALTVPAAAISILFIVAGGLTVGAARTSVDHRRDGLKYGGMVLSIMAAVGSIIIIFLGIAELLYIFFIGGNASYFLPLIIMSALSFSLCFFELCIAIATSSVACCCSPVG